MFQEWEKAKVLLNPTRIDPEGVMPRLNRFKVKMYDTEDMASIAKRAAEMMEDLNFEDIDRTSPAASTLFVWVRERNYKDLLYVHMYMHSHAWFFSFSDEIQLRGDSEPVELRKRKASRRSEAAEDFRDGEEEARAGQESRCETTENATCQVQVTPTTTTLKNESRV